MKTEPDTEGLTLVHYTYMYVYKFYTRCNLFSGFIAGIYNDIDSRVVAHIRYPSVKPKCHEFG